MPEKENTNSEEGTNSWEDRNPEEYNLETFRQAIEDVRRTHAYQIEAYDDIDEKSWRILQFDGVVATVATAGIVNLQPPFPWYVWSLSLGGFAGLAISTYLALDGQPENRITVGPGTNDFQKVNSMNPEEAVYLSWMVRNYTKYFEEGVEKVERNAEAIDRAKVFSIISVGLLLTSGLLYAATGPLL